MMTQKLVVLMVVHREIEDEQSAYPKDLITATSQVVCNTLGSIYDADGYGFCVRAFISGDENNWAETKVVIDAAIEEVKFSLEKKDRFEVKDHSEVPGFNAVRTVPKDKGDK